MAKILVIDNYDSFTYNLVQYIGDLVKGAEPIRVFRNNQVVIEEIKRMKPDRIVVGCDDVRVAS